MPLESSSEQPKSLTMILAALDWVYERAISGVPGVDSAIDSAHSASRGGARAGDDAVDALIKRHIMEAGTAGFLANVGGVLTLPLSLPANLGSVLFIQLRMIAGIAHLRGYDVHSHQVKALAMACLGGSAALDVLKNAGITLGTNLTHRAIAHISTAALARINRAVGIFLVSKAGTAGAVTLSKIVPLVGGAVGGTIDGLATKAIAVAAKKVFRPIDTPAATRRNLVEPLPLAKR
ncbi:MAG: EcsC family protein [Acetobacteraceae bacterium]